MTRLFLIIFVSFSFLGCQKENATDCFKSTGKEMMQTRFPGEFDQIRIIDKFEVTIFKSNACKVEVIAGGNVIGSISTKVIDGVLFLENNNKCNFVRGYKHSMKINVYLPYIAFMVNDGVGIVRIDDNYTQDSISVRVSSSGDFYLNGTYKSIKTSSSGNGDMYISGQAKNLYVYTNGINFVNTENLKVSDYMFIHSVTIGDCFINAEGTKLFDYNIQKEGNIYYSGSPAKIANYSEPTAKGQLIHED